MVLKLSPCFLEGLPGDEAGEQGKLRGPLPHSHYSRSLLPAGDSGNLGTCIGKH